ncbi:MAG: sugar transferase [Bacteroidales bacterium]|nr:sugar transferase [Bacteroidales bacterium]
MLKRAFDIMTSFIGLIILSPVLLFVFLIIKVFMGGTVFFIQERTGKYGKPFKIIKFRTMRPNHGGNTLTIQGESRITPLGSIIRKYKLDELPELLNVLKGDMSLVGPRPDMPEYMERLVGEEREILEIRPGITCPASIKYSNEESLLANADDSQKYYELFIWPDKVKLNLEYCRNRSFFGDIILILKTLFGKHKNNFPKIE